MQLLRHLLLSSADWKPLREEPFECLLTDKEIVEYLLSGVLPSKEKQSQATTKTPAKLLTRAASGISLGTALHERNQT